MNLNDYELCDTVVEDYKIIITKMTKHFIFLKIQLQPDEEPLIFKKRLRLIKRVNILNLLIVLMLIKIKVYCI